MYTILNIHTSPSSPICALSIAHIYTLKHADLEISVLVEQQLTFGWLVRSMGYKKKRGTMVFTVHGNFGIFAVVTYAH